MLKSVISIAAATAVMGAAAVAEECKFEGEAPAMPDPDEATAEVREAAIAEIKAYQAALAEYRECLDKTIQNVELEDEVRQAALDKYNATVDEETEVVTAWQQFDAAYQEENS